MPFPLLKLFYFLRRQGWVLGIDDYLSILKVIETGISVGDWQQLTEICQLLWTKTEQEAQQLEKMCENLKKNREDNNLFEQQTPVKEKNSQKNPENTSVKPLMPPRQLDYMMGSDPVDKVKAEMTFQVEEEDQEIAESRKRIKSSQSSSIPSVTYRFRRNYFPLTPREMKQRWRFLRRPLREGIPSELDIEATITKVCQEGLICTPVLRPPRINRADLVLLIDQKGSMVPFHPLSRQLRETAQRDGKLRQANVYYFHNCPEQSEKDHENEDNYVLFRQPNLLQKITLRELSTTLDRRAVVLIVSDAGAARGWYDADRIEQSRLFLEQFIQLFRHCAWLNPMPTQYWKGSSAAAIAEFVPMFPLNNRGFNNAIALLQGRYVTGEQPNP
ncbi:MAG: hypothetical protein AB4063_14955 [Crocosphaera sp.]